MAPKVLHADTVNGAQYPTTTCVYGSLDNESNIELNAMLNKIILE